MNKYTFTFACILLVGCGHEEVVVRPDVESRVFEVDTSHSLAESNVSLDELSEAAPAKTSAKDSVQELVVNKDSADSPLVITDRLVNWGFTSANRERSDIDTVIIHSVYNALKGQKHGLTEILDVFEGYGVSSHYIITRDGVIHRLVREKNIAYHVGRSRTPDGRTQVNQFSLGIEMVNSLDDTYTEVQYASLQKLLEELSQKYEIKYVLGHDEVGVGDPWHFDWGKINEFRHDEK